MPPVFGVHRHLPFGSIVSPYLFIKKTACLGKIWFLRYGEKRETETETLFLLLLLYDDIVGVKLFTLCCEYYYYTLSKSYYKLMYLKVNLLSLVCNLLIIHSTVNLLIRLVEITIIWCLIILLTSKSIHQSIYWLLNI